MIMNLPNKITLARICMIPLFVLFFYLEMIPCNFLIAAFIFLAAALTDALDGYIARSRGLVTNLGKFLDPIADKVLVSTAFISLLTRPYVFYTPMGDAGWIIAGVCVAVILARELIVSGFRMIAAGRNLVLAADKLGKIKTILQDVAIAILLASTPFLGGLGGFVVACIGLACFFACTVLTVVSGVNYIVKNIQVLKDEPKTEEVEGEPVEEVVKVEETEEQE